MHDSWRLLHPVGLVHCEVLASQISPGPQHAVQPHSVFPDGQSDAQVLFTHV